MIAIANVSGFYGDRIAAAREIVDAHREGRVHVDVITGDWLAELTMGLLAKQRERTGSGWATTFVTQMTDVLGECLDAGIRVVANAGGLDPAGCAQAVAAIDPRATVAWVTGDDVTERVAGLPHLDTGEVMPDEPLVANAYLGCRGIVAALEAGADVVVTGRVTDAAVVLGPAAWHFGWTEDDLDAMAGAVAAGHVIECGAQATGGNFPFAAEFDATAHIGLPVAEIDADGSAVITKAAGTDGAVTPETVTAQLLYEVDGPRYLTPDVVVRLDTVALTADGPDRVRMAGTRGEPPPGTVKAGAVLPAGWHNEITLVLTGLDIDAKAEQALAALWAGIPGGRDAYDHVATRLLRADHPDPARMTDAVALLTVAVAGDRKRSRGSPAPASRAPSRATRASSPPPRPAPAAPRACSGPCSCPPPTSPRPSASATAPGRCRPPRPPTPRPPTPLPPPPRPPIPRPPTRERRAPSPPRARAPSGHRSAGWSARGRATRAATRRSGCGRARTGRTRGSRAGGTRCTSGGCSGRTPRGAGCDCGRCRTCGRWA